MIRMGVGPFYFAMLTCAVGRPQPHWAWLEFKCRFNDIMRQSLDRCHNQREKGRSQCFNRSSKHSKVGKQSKASLQGAETIWLQQNAAASEVTLVTILITPPWEKVNLKTFWPFRDFCPVLLVFWRTKFTGSTKADVSDYVWSD